jgi:hypothetical protein
VNGGRLSFLPELSFAFLRGLKLGQDSVSTNGSCLHLRVQRAHMDTCRRPRALDFLLSTMLMSPVLRGCSILLAFV